MPAGSGPGRKLHEGGPGGRGDLAEKVEEEQIECGNIVLEGAQEVLADEVAGEVAVRFALTLAVLSLRDVLLIAHSRGERLPDSGVR
ncbi:sulfatase [Streptomyces sp. CS090A]|uniref:sulfatase n=1 Tax=Streptomyces sp. CS090A TaxID=2162710 RepID=UPI000D512A8D|nr:sulfatase [Streptomyces sp. CS090A]PVC94925.1 sulfatase [Streptomyces sp. CS090A]